MPSTGRHPSRPAALAAVQPRDRQRRRPPEEPQLPGHAGGRWHGAGPALRPAQHRGLPCPRLGPCELVIPMGEATSIARRARPTCGLGVALGVRNGPRCGSWATSPPACGARHPGCSKPSRRASMAGPSGEARLLRQIVHGVMKDWLDPAGRLRAEHSRPFRRPPHYLHAQRVRHDRAQGCRQRVRHRVTGAAEKTLERSAPSCARAVLHRSASHERQNADTVITGARAAGAERPVR